MHFQLPSCLEQRVKTISRGKISYCEIENTQPRYAEGYTPMKYSYMTRSYVLSICRWRLLFWHRRTAELLSKHRYMQLRNMGNCENKCET